MRYAETARKTKETDIVIKLNLDGKGKAEIDSGNGFFNHMLELFTSHARFDMTVKCTGDTDVDFHHSAEDIGIALGQSLKKAVANKAGLARYGYIILPMDEALILCSADLSGRSHLNYDVEVRTTRIADDADEQVAKVGGFDTELVEEFLYALVRNAEMTLHIKKLDGKNTHHIIEGVFKALGRVLRACVSADSRYDGEIPSTKGAL